MNAGAILRRLWTSAVVWSWAFSGFRIGSNLLLLPLLMRLPENDFGFYWVLLSLLALAPLLDLGFLTAIDRAVSYAMGGATELQAQGVAPPPATGAQPNHALLWKLLFTTRALYRFLALGVFLVLGAWGSYVVSLRAHETAHPTHTWIAWGLTLLAAVFESYSGWWNVYLRGLNQVLRCMRILALAYLLKFVLSCVLLANGAGLLSVPIAMFIATFLQRALSRRASLKLLAPFPVTVPTRAERIHLIRTLWPNSWRIGLQLLSGYLTINANTFVCLKVLGLGANAEYGLSVQITVACQAMALVWVSVKWPLIFQLRARHEVAELRRLLWPRVWLLNLTFFVLAGMVLAVGRPALAWLGSGKTMLPTVWLCVLLFNGFMEMQFNVWGTLILTENRSPFLWPTVATNTLSLCLVIALVLLTPLGVGALVMGPLIAGSLFNYWNWPLAGARTMKTTLLRFLFRKPE